MDPGKKRHTPHRAAKQSGKKQKQRAIESPPLHNDSPVKNFWCILELGSMVWEFLNTADISSVLQACSNRLSEECTNTVALQAIDKFAVENRIHLGRGCSCDWIRRLDYSPHAESKCSLSEEFGIDKTLLLHAARSLLDALMMTKKMLEPFWSLNEQHEFFVPVVIPLGTEENPHPNDQPALVRAMNNVTQSAGVRFFYNFRGKRGSTAKDFLYKHWDSINAESCKYCENLSYPSGWRARGFRGTEPIRSLCKTVYQPLKAAMEKDLQFVRFIPTPRRLQNNRSEKMCTYAQRYKGLVAGISTGGVLCGLYLSFGY